MNIGGRAIGPEHAPYIIAEIGVNHDGALKRACELVRAAGEAGADAVKFQYFTARGLMSRSSRLAQYQAQAGERDPVAMLARLELEAAALEECIGEARDAGVHAIVSVFSIELVEPARRLGWDAFKTASPDIINRPLLCALAADSRPLIISTGASTLEEVERALGWLDSAKGRLAVLDCVSCYPAPDDAVDLEGMAALMPLAPGRVGYSDHSPHVETGARFVRGGAVMLEKHLTYDRRAAGPDHAASLDPAQFARYVRLAREAWNPDAARRGAALASPGRKIVRECERDVRSVSRQSLVTARALPAGHTLVHADLTIKRPGTGVPPYELQSTIGRCLAREIAADTVIMPEDLA